MAIYAYSPELALEFRRTHRRQVVKKRHRERREKTERPRDVKHAGLDADLQRAIDRDRDRD